MPSRMALPGGMALVPAFTLIAHYPIAHASPPAHTERQPTVQVTEKSVSGPDGQAYLIVIAQPRSAIHRPAVLILHGTHGFADDYIELARDLADQGFVAVAACWFAPGRGNGMRFVTPRACPAGTPPLVGGDTPEAKGRVDALLGAVARLPGVDPDRIVVMGHSRGGVAALYRALDGHRARVVILNSSAYPPSSFDRATGIRAPVLIMHGEQDSPSDGGSDMTAAARAHSFVSLLQ